ncbi:MAG: CC0125/CC1285 family lipoprotein [Caulobacteraceae bacterium]
MKRIAIAAAAVLALSLTLAACETPTPYQPLAPGNAVAGGFADQRLDATHYRVSFRGNDMTSRDQVESYLLYRAAELTVNSGFDWFEMVERHTRNHGGAYVEPMGPGPWGPYWEPYWRFHGGWGWGYWDPLWGGPFWNGYDVQQVDEYEAVAEIAMGHGPKPADNPRAFDAREVLGNLGPHIVRPH